MSGGLYGRRKFSNRPQSVPADRHDDSVTAPCPRTVVAGVSGISIRRRIVEYHYVVDFGRGTEEKPPTRAAGVKHVWCIGRDRPTPAPVCFRIRTPSRDRTRPIKRFALSGRPSGWNVNDNTRVPFPRISRSLPGRNTLVAGRRNYIFRR